MTAYQVLLFGGSISENRPYSVVEIIGFEADPSVELRTDKEEARAKARRLNKLLSPGERAHYGLKYKVVNVVDGIYCK